MERSTALDFAGSIEAAAAIVTEGTAMFAPEELAGQYAFEAARDGGQGTESEWVNHMICLRQAGAQFSSSGALMIARAFAACVPA